MTSILLVRARKLATIVRHRALIAPLRHGLVASVEHEHLTRLPVAHVIDVGANRGQFSIWARVRLKSPVIDAFEPLPSAADFFEQLVASPTTRLHRVALGATTSTERFYVTSNDDSSSFLQATPRQVALFSGSEATSSISVPVTTLDEHLDSDSIRRPCLLKIDVQGFEWDVLCGSATTLAAVDYVYVECSFVELYERQTLASPVVDLLIRAGFDLTGAHNPHYDSTGACVQADLLFERTAAR